MLEVLKIIDGKVTTQQACGWGFLLWKYGIVSPLLSTTPTDLGVRYNSVVMDEWNTQVNLMVRDI